MTAERDRLQLVGAITTAKSEASTNAITAKGSELTKATLTEVLIDGFSAEFIGWAWSGWCCVRSADAGVC